MIPGLAGIMRRLKERGFGTIFFRNLALLSVLIVLPIVLVAGVAALSFSAFIKSEIVSYSYKSVQSYKALTEAMIADYMVQSHYLSNDSDIELFLLRKKGEEVYYDRNAIFKSIASQMSIKDYLDSIYIYSNKNGMLISNYGESDYNAFFDHSWMEEYQSNTIPSRFWCTFRTGLNNQNQPIPMLSIYKALGTLNDNQGVIVFNINFEKFSRQFAGQREANDTALLLVDARSKVLADIWKDGPPVIPPSVLAGLEGSRSYVESGSAIYYKEPVRYTDWQYILQVSKSMYHQSVRSLQGWMLLILAVWLLATVVIAILISRRIYRPVRKILGVVGGFVPLAEENPALQKDEEAFILHTIQKALKESESAGEQLAERIAMLKKAQSIALQSQINPHFLHNTLDTINWSAMRLTGGKNETSTMIAQLAAMLRYSLEHADVLVPLEKELKHIRTYLELQKHRYQNKFEVEWDITDEVRSCLVIRIMLQPVLENAIYHGIKPLEDKGRIHISARRNGENLEIKVKDFGVGMSPQKVHKLNSLMQEADIQEKAHLGIPNVNQRIRLFFGAQYGIALSSREQQGTEVLIRLPYAEGPPIE